MQWTDKLPQDIYNRLCNCKSTKQDIPTLTNIKWAYMQETGKDKEGFTKEDALIAVLELLDCNSCLVELTIDEYDELCR